MKLKNPMLVVTDIDKSVEFYKKVFGLHVIMDFGANKTLTGGLALQTIDKRDRYRRQNSSDDGRACKTDLQRAGDKCGKAGGCIGAVTTEFL